jgi:hypothetical protein
MLGQRIVSTFLSRAGSFLEISLITSAGMLAGNELFHVFCAQRRRRLARAKSPRSVSATFGQACSSPDAATRPKPSAHFLIQSLHRLTCCFVASDCTTHHRLAHLLPPPPLSLRSTSLCVLASASKKTSRRIAILPTVGCSTSPRTL